MTVAELIAKLQTYPQDYQVLVLDKDGRPEDSCHVGRGFLQEDPNGDETFIGDEAETDDPGFIAIYAF